MKTLLVVSMGLASLPMFGQVPVTRATVIMGAGRAGSWNTEIAITNTNSSPLPILVTAQYNRIEECGVMPCNDYAITTIPGFGTFVLPSIPPPADPTFSNRPQAFYVLSPSSQPAPAVRAFASDSASECGRGTPLPVLMFGDAFSLADLFFAGITKDASRHGNLMIAAEPDYIDTLHVGVAVLDGSGNVLTINSYDVPPGHPLLIVDVLGSLGVTNLAGGSIHLSESFTPSNEPFVPFAAALTIVKPDQVQAVPGLRIGQP